MGNEYLNNLISYHEKKNKEFLNDIGKNVNGYIIICITLSLIITFNVILCYNNILSILTLIVTLFMSLLIFKIIYDQIRERNEIINDYFKNTEDNLNSKIIYFNRIYKENISIIKIEKDGSIKNIE